MWLLEVLMMHRCVVWLLLLIVVVGMRMKVMGRWVLMMHEVGVVEEIIGRRVDVRGCG